MASRYAEAHAHPKGPGDARPTALQIVEDEGLVGGLKGKSIFITGASSGIGIETARALYTTGAKLYFGVRDPKKAEAVAADISGSSSPDQIEIIKLDLSSLASVRDGAKEFLSKTDKLNILINNAGVMLPPPGRTPDGFDEQLQTNHLSHHLLFQLLKPALLAASTPGFNSRVVTVSSTGHRSSPLRFDDLHFDKEPYDGLAAYGQSKTANIYLANEIEKRYGTQGIHANSLGPGGCWSPLARHMDLAEWGPMLEMFKQEPLKSMIKSPEQCAATTVWAAIGREWEGQGGKYLEDCAVSPPITKTDYLPLEVGYAPYAFDVEAASRLWDVSNKLVGLKA